ncbi:hypothetical protein TNCV_2148181 [Trichonephila clavipes]|uniref:Uncharacterized protein n=1 Tax=Trichonephila clavipes TaxID=2585209 RepID=A0A8X6SY50_TRICX|nr:hypothetical protein TNCV_2148181 [Trichonephila clavipes]
MYGRGLRDLTPQRCSCSVYRQCVREGHVSEKSSTTLNHDTGCRTSMAMHNATFHQPLTKVSPNSNPTIVTLQAEEGFVSKHNVVPFRCPRPSFIAPLVVQTIVVSQSRVNEAVDALRTFYFAANGIEWYERTPNDA